MEQEKKQAVALMRYSAIAPLITGTQEDYESLSAYFRTVSAKGIKAPDGSLRHYSPGTLEKWYLAYRKSGFDALVPTGRSDCGASRKIDGDLKEQIIYLKRHYPRMSAAAIYKQRQHPLRAALRIYGLPFHQPARPAAAPDEQSGYAALREATHQ